ncbi:MAG: hypothetical protein ACJKTH_00435 [Patescibacteria group bacterium UBA2163]
MKVKEKVSKLTVAKKRTYPNFFLYLLGFVVILAVSFSTLALIANQVGDGEVEVTSSQASDESNTAGTP